MNYRLRFNKKLRYKLQQRVEPVPDETTLLVTIVKKNANPEILCSPAAKSSSIINAWLVEIQKEICSGHASACIVAMVRARSDYEAKQKSLFIIPDYDSIAVVESGSKLETALLGKIANSPLIKFQSHFNRYAIEPIDWTFIEDMMSQFPAVFNGKTKCGRGMCTFCYPERRI